MNNKQLKRMALGLILGLQTSSSYAQPKTVITGIVKGENKIPIPGAMVTIKEGNRMFGTVAQLDGNYAIEIDDSIDSFILEYRFMGMIAKRFAVQRDTRDKNKFLFKSIDKVKN